MHMRTLLEALQIIKKQCQLRSIPKINKKEINSTTNKHELKLEKKVGYFLFYSFLFYNIYELSVSAEQNMVILNGDLKPILIMPLFVHVCFTKFTIFMLTIE